MARERPPQEDAARAGYYAQNAKRNELAAAASDVDSFLASLGMRMRVEPVHELNLERATQLVNKSNQFNLTTRRFTAAQMRDMAASPDWVTLTLSLRDSLGDNGLISVLLLKKQGDALAVDTWVMSCRVLKRGVEAFTRNEVVEAARRAGAARLLGTYIPTAKNGMVRDHYAGLGFEAAGADGETTFWAMRVEGVEPVPHFIQREAASE